MPSRAESRASAEPLVAPVAAPGELRLGLAGDGNLRWAAADVTGPIEEARRRLDLSPIGAVALGRASAAATLLLRFWSKSPGRLILEVAGDGPLGKIVAEVDDAGNLRGLVGQGQLPTPDDGVLSLAAAVGRGFLRVTRDRPGNRPYTSQVALVSGEIGKDLAHFLDQSEQIRSAALVGVLPRPDGIAAAGGLLVEALPGCPEAVVEHLERTLAGLDGVSRLLEQGGVEGLAATVLDGFDREELERWPMRFHCRCDRESLREKLLGIAASDLGALVDERGECVAECAFCGEVYVYSSAELLPA